MASILVLDDEPLIASLLGDWLHEMGHRPVHLTHSLADALVVAKKSPLDAAILDLSLGRADSLPLAALLAERGVPFAFATGHGADSLPGRFDGSPVLAKPFEFEDVRAAVARMLEKP